MHVLHLPANNVGMMAGVGMYGSQGMIARNVLTLSIHGRVFFCLLSMELLRSFLGGKGCDMKADRKSVV